MRTSSVRRARSHRAVQRACPSPAPSAASQLSRSEQPTLPQLPTTVQRGEQPEAQSPSVRASAFECYLAVLLSTTCNEESERVETGTREAETSGAEFLANIAPSLSVHLHMVLIKMELRKKMSSSLTVAEEPMM